MQTPNYDDIKQVVRDLCMMNNKFMNLMLDDNIEAAQIMLRVILKDDTIKVIKVRIQDFIQNLYGYSAQLDILAQDSTGKLFNVEIQRSDEGAPAKRARFYSSALDTRFLRSGADYEDLPDIYVIFITENDVLNDNLLIYNIERTISQNGKSFADGSHILYVNSQYQNDTALGRLMQDLYCKNPAELHYNEFSKRMEALKCIKEGEENMTDIIEIYAENKARKAAKEAAEKATEETALKTKKETARNLLKTSLPIEAIAEATNLPVEEVLKLAELQSA